MQKLDLQELKKSGILKQRQKDMFSLRLRVPVGKLEAEQLERLAQVCRKYGRGFVHLTMRQGVEIPWVHYESFENVRKELTEVGILPGACGPRVRCVTACHGNSLCPHGVVDAQRLGLELDRRFFSRDVPTKFKFSVSGCVLGCSKPRENDFGLMGMVEPEWNKEACTGCGLCAKVCKEGAIVMEEDRPQFDISRCNYCGECINACPTESWGAKRVGLTLFVGGKMGRHPQLGYKIGEFFDEERALEIAEKTLEFFRQEGKPGERFGVLLNRMGLDKFKERVL